MNSSKDAGSWGGQPLSTPKSGCPALILSLDPKKVGGAYMSGPGARLAPQRKGCLLVSMIQDPKRTWSHILHAGQVSVTRKARALHAHGLP